MPTWDKAFRNMIWTGYFTFALYLVNTFVSIINYQIFPEKNWASIIKRALSGIIGSLIFSFITGIILYVFMLLIQGNSYDYIWDWLFSIQSFESFKQLVWISGTIAVTFYVFTSIREYQANKLKTQKEKTIRISTEHESLKSQIGPHFLFNSLNVLNGLISENQDKAQEFVGELSSVYRYVLEQKDKTLVSLKEEIDFAQTYMNLVQKRFEEGLEFEISGEIKDEMQIVPLSLQILLENCIKHNRISADEILKIKVSVNEDYLLIHNNLQIKNLLQKSTGKGLNNIRERYKSFTRRKVEIEETADEFIVRIPLLTEKFRTMEINQNYTREEIKAAKKRVEELQGFYWNLISFVIILPFLHFVDLRDGSYNWAFWPLIGWSIGITFHAIEVFGMFNSSSWKDRQIQKELEKRQRERDKFMGNYN